MSQLGAYKPSVISAGLSIIPAFMGNITDNHLPFLFAGICLGISIHQWIVAYAKYGLKGSA